MSELRKQFEALPVISAVTNRGIYFCKENNMYKGGVDNDYYWINGAWYAFQEQQKIIDHQNQRAIDQSAHLQRVQEHNAKLQKRLKENGIPWQDLI